MNGSDPSRWFLPASGSGTACGSWGAETEIASRPVPWDFGCTATPLIGGFAAMNAMCAAFEAAIAEANAAGAPPGRRGYVYFAGWRLNPLRDLSAGNSWGTHGWNGAVTAIRDQTVAGLFLRMLEAGLRLRVLLWFPHSAQQRIGLTDETAQEHRYVLTLVRAKCAELTERGFPRDLGIVALDTRIGAFAGSHHQKMVVVRGAGATHAAFCGGLDLAFTRRDAPADPSCNAVAVHDGDWQSGISLPGGESPAFSTAEWPRQPGVAYPRVGPEIRTPGRVIGSDLPYRAYGRANQLWHDQHLKLEGTVVLTLEQQFRERWIDPAPPGYAAVAPDARDAEIRANAVYVSGEDAIRDPGPRSELVPLPSPEPLPPDAAGGRSVVQMWRTIPVRDRGGGRLFARGEFSLLAGIANACARAYELIWIFEQYLWSRPLCRLLNAALRDPSRPGLHVVVLLPPYPDAHPATVFRARRLAFADVTRGLSTAQLARVRVYTMWHRARERGIYVHAKTQTYDGSLLVCGSANLNRRSFLCDTELDCAVLDRDLVRDHQRALWQLLFPASRPIDEELHAPLDLDIPGSGKRFFDALTRAATPASHVVEDPDFVRLGPDEPGLPHGWPRRPARALDPLRPRVPGFLLDPASLAAVSSLERDGRGGIADLHEIARRLGADSPTRPIWRC